MKQNRGMSLIWDLIRGKMRVIVELEPVVRLWPDGF